MQGALPLTLSPPRPPGTQPKAGWGTRHPEREGDPVVDRDDGCGRRSRLSA